jgi:hypothetical protein
MTGCQQRNHHFVDHPLLTDHGPADLRLEASRPLDDFRCQVAA